MDNNIFDPYDGFGTIEELSSAMDKLDIQCSLYVIFKYLGEYYAVLQEGFNKQIAIGREWVYYRDNGFMKVSKLSDFEVPYVIEKRSWHYPVTDTLARELAATDKHMKVYIFRTKNSKKPTIIEELPLNRYINFFIVLAASFFVYEFPFKRENKHLKKYFRNYEAFDKLQKGGNTRINPFRQYVVSREGKIIYFQFLRYQKFNGYKTMYRLETKENNIDTVINKHLKPLLPNIEQILNSSCKCINCNKKVTGCEMFFVLKSNNVGVCRCLFKGSKQKIKKTIDSGVLGSVYFLSPVTCKIDNKKQSRCSCCKRIVKEKEIASVTQSQENTLCEHCFYTERGQSLYLNWICDGLYNKYLYKKI